MTKYSYKFAIKGQLKAFDEVMSEVSKNMNDMFNEDHDISLIAPVSTATIESLTPLTAEELEKARSELERLAKENLADHLSHIKVERVK